MPLVDFWLAAFAGFAAGYVMALGAFWLEGYLGLPRIDFGHTGMMYVGGDRPGWWAVGILAHLIDSVLLGLLYARAVYPSLPALGLAQRDLLAGVAAGVVYGIGLWLVLAMLIVMPLTGAGPFGVRTGSVRPALATFGIHIVYGAILGAVYLV